MPAVPEKGATDRSRDSVNLDNSDALDVAQRIAGQANRGLHFRRDPDSGRLIAELVNQDTGEVVRTIPPDEVLKLSARIGDALDILFGHRGDPARPDGRAAR